MYVRIFNMVSPLFLIYVYMFALESQKSAISSFTKHHIKTPNEAQCEECGAVTSSHLAMENNCAYQSVDAATTMI